MLDELEDPRGVLDERDARRLSTLRALERDGYVSRKLTPTSPPRTDYALTPMGREVTIFEKS